MPLIAEETPIVLVIEPIRDWWREEVADEIESASRAELVDRLPEPIKHRVTSITGFADRDFGGSKIGDVGDASSPSWMFDETG